MEQTPAECTAAAVRAEMARHNVRAYEMAKDIGLTPATMSRRLSGRYPFTITELVGIADRLGVPLTDLLPQQAAA